MRSLPVLVVQPLEFVRHRGPIDTRRCRSLVAPALLASFLMIASPIEAVAAPASTYKVLRSVLEFALEAVVKPAAAEGVKAGVDYVLDPAKKQQANEYKAELKVVNNQLNAALANPDNSTAKATELKQEIGATDTQLDALDKLENGLSAKQYQDLLQGVQASLQQVTATVESDQRRLDQLESEMQTLNVRLASLETHGVGSQSAGLRDADLMPPSFNCANARTSAEKLVCSNPQLGDADGRLGKAYSDLRYFMSPNDFISMRDSERAWIRSRDDRLATECTRDSAIEVQCAMSLWQARTQMLQATLKTVRADMYAN